MFFTYLGEVLKRAFTPTAKVTDGLQIAAASALPALASFTDFNFPEGTEDNVLALIGLWAVGLIGIRLIWAPYAMWRDQVCANSTLRFELSKPERLVTEKLAALRAKKLQKLINMIFDLHVRSQVSKDEDKGLWNRKLFAIEKAVFSSGLGRSEYELIQDFFDRIWEYRLAGKHLHETFDEFAFLSDLVAMLHGEVSAELLASRLPPRTETQLLR